SSRATRSSRPEHDGRRSTTLGAPLAGPRFVCGSGQARARDADNRATEQRPEQTPQRRVSVPISYSGDVGGFLFDLLSDIDSIVWEADADTFTIEFVNDRVHDLLGYDPMDIVAEPDFWSTQIVHPDDREAFLASEHEVLARGAARVTYRALGTTGAVVWLSSVARLTTDQGGRRRVRGVETDVTAMKRAEDEARES